MKLKQLIFATLICIAPQISMATSAKTTLINDMATCQALLDFIDIKLNSAPSKYETVDVNNVRKGLKGYNQYIQKQIVSPGLLEFNGGDNVKADMMQKQSDEYKTVVVKGFQKRYPQKRLFMDHAISVNNCAKKAVPAGQALEDLKVALNTMVKLSKLE